MFDRISQVADVIIYKNETGGELPRYVKGLITPLLKKMCESLPVVEFFCFYIVKFLGLQSIRKHRVYMRIKGHFTSVA